MLKGNWKSLQCIILFMTFLFLSTLSAQTVTIRGKVVDAVTKDPLPGANIILLGTSIGTASNNEGKFIIRNIPAGKYNIKTSYVGYKTNEFNTELKAGRIFETDIKLYPASIEGQTVTVTAQASGQNEAINQQLTSDQIKNVVSLARIQELPDANAAESVARLPGVSLIREGGEGSQVVIRGLSPQYNEITIDGIQLPGNVVSNNPNSQSSLMGDRATNLSMISSSMLGGIEVIKAITPDMDAAVLGGVVNFGLRKAVKGDSPTFGLQIQGSHNELKNTTNDYMLVGSYEQRFFDQKLGLFLLGSIEKRDRSSNELGVNYQLNDKTHGDQGIPDLNSLSMTDVYRILERDGITAVMDYSHSSGEIDFYNFFSASNTRLTNLISIKQDLPVFHVDLKLSHTYSENHNPGDLSFKFWQQNAGLSGMGNVSKLNPKKLAS
ncbi:MAG: carboxypeptidase-like regulatory domain-containing protein [Ignavibacteriaceae bacterium]